MVLICISVITNVVKHIFMLVMEKFWLEYLAAAKFCLALLGKSRVEVMPGVGVWAWLRDNFSLHCFSYRDHLSRTSSHLAG